MNNPRSLEEQLLNLRKKYAEQLPQKIKGIHEAANCYFLLANPKNLLHFYDLIHKLTGSGATYGFPEISKIAQELEKKLTVLYEQSQTISSEEQQQIQELVQTLEKVTNDELQRFYR